MYKYRVLPSETIGKEGQGETKLVALESDIDKIKQSVILENGEVDFNHIKSLGDLFIQKYVMKVMDYDQFVEKESQILKSLDHLNIVKYIDSFRDGSKFHIIMEYAKDGDLRHRICEQKGNAFTECFVLRVFNQICDAICYAHNKNILHSDLKPENVFFDNYCRLYPTIKLRYFGIAKQLRYNNRYSNTFCGTNSYVAPEVLRGGEFNKKADIYSLGCILFELLTLRQYKYPDDPNNAQFPCEFEYDDSVYQYKSNDKWRHLLKIMLSNDPGNRPSIEQVISIVETISYNNVKFKFEQNENCTIF